MICRPYVGRLALGRVVVVLVDQAGHCDQCQDPISGPVRLLIGPGYRLESVGPVDGKKAFFRRL